MEIVTFAFSDVWARCVSSYERETSEYDQRVAEGKQPFSALLDLNTVVGLEVGYFLTLAVLYAWMRKRATPFKLLTVMRVYNFVCAALAGVVVVGILWFPPKRFMCNETDVETEDGYWRAWAIWVYYAQKYFEFLDTVFIILKQSWRQLSFLHVYHHASVALVVRQFLLYDINGDCFLAAWINAFIHVLMYSHYLLSTFGVRTWWRKYITQMQLLQFVIIFIQMGWSYLSGPDCGLGDFLKVMQLGYMVTMIALFTNFYVKSYSENKQVKAKDS